MFIKQDFLIKRLNLFVYYSLCRFGLSEIRTTIMILGESLGTIRLSGLFLTQGQKVYMTPTPANTSLMIGDVVLLICYLMD